MKNRFKNILIAGVLAPTLGGAAHAAPSVIGFDGAMPNLADVQIESGNVYDYTFTSAPTDWLVQSGVWEMTNRWSCSPGWSWFGGRSEEVASIWNKRKFSGDVSIQFYFAFKMGMTGTTAWAEKCSDAASDDGHNSTFERISGQKVHRKVGLTACHLGGSHWCGGFRRNGRRMTHR
jgi:hypothetical protein